MWTPLVADSVGVSLAAGVRRRCGGCGGKRRRRLVSPVSLSYQLHVFVRQRNVTQKLI